MTDPAAQCFAEWQDGDGLHAYACELPAGHSGEHEVTLMWAQDPPPVPGAHKAVEAPTGYEYYLAGKYGGPDGMNGLAASFGQPARCPDLRCTLAAGHEGLHEDHETRWTDPIPIQRGPFDVR